MNSTNSLTVTGAASSHTGGSLAGLVKDIASPAIDTITRDAVAMASIAQGEAALALEHQEAVGGTIEDFASVIRKAGEEPSEKVSDMKDQIGDTVAHAREAGRSTAGKVTSTAQNTARLAQESGRWLGQIIDDAVQGEPLIVGAAGVAVGVAVGLAIGSALPRTSVEETV